MTKALGYSEEHYLHVCLPQFGRLAVSQRPLQTPFTASLLLFLVCTDSVARLARRTRIGLMHRRPLRHLP